MLEGFYQVKIIAYQNDEARQRIAHFLSLLAKHKKEEEIFKLLADDLPFLLTSRAPWQTASSLQKRLEKLGATVETHLLLPDSDPHNESRSVNTALPPRAAVTLEEEETAWRKKEQLPRPSAQQGEPVATLRGIEKEVYLYLERNERKKFLAKLQTLAEEEGHIPPMPFLLSRKMARSLQYMGGMLLGTFLGIFTTFFIFILFVWLLHLEFY